MRVSVTFRNFTTSEPIKTYAEEKVSRLARFLSPRHRANDLQFSTPCFRNNVRAYSGVQPESAY